MTLPHERVWPVVGRDHHIDRALAAARAGRGVLLVGTPGVGKTAIARVVADTIEDDDPTSPPTRVAATPITGLPIATLALPDVEPGAPSRRGQVVFVDDVHLVDDDDAALLHQLTVEGRITIVATVRSDEPTPAAITALWKDDLVDRIDLGPIERTDVDELIDLVLPGPVDAGARRVLWDLTLGWPLMFRELIRSSLESSMLVQVNGLWRFVENPSSTRLDELIGDRLDALSPGAFELVELLALGEPVGFELLRTTVSLEHIDEAERRGAIDVVTDRSRRDARLAHPIFGDVVRRRMTASRRTIVSARLLEMIETTPMRRRDDIVRATTWQLEAGGTTVTDDMALAARRALYADEHRLAIELAQRALQGDPGRKDVALLLAEALLRSGRTERVSEIDDVDGHDAIGVGERAVIAMQRAFTLFWGFGDAVRAEAVIEAAVAATPPGPWHDELRAERAILASNSGEHAVAAEIVDRMLERPDLSDRAFVTAAVSASCTRSVDGRCLDALDLCERAYSMSEAMGPLIGMTTSGIFVVSQVTSLTEVGRLDDAERLGRAVRDVVLADGRLDGQAWFSMTLGRVLLAIGRATEAEERFVEASAAFAGIHSHGQRHWALAGAVMAAALRGDADAAHRHDEQRRSIPPHPAGVMDPEVSRAAAHLALVDGDRRGAIALLRVAIDDHHGRGAAALTGWLLHDIVRFGGTVEPHEAALIDRCQGPLAAAREALFEADRRGDADALEAVAGRFAALGSPLFAAEVLLTASARRSGDALDLDEIRLRSAADRHLAELPGERPITADVHARRATDVLTPREHEVADLASRGRTNREIADELYVSVRTVENHLQRVYVKLGIGGRRELTSIVS